MHAQLIFVFADFKLFELVQADRNYMHIIIKGIKKTLGVPSNCTNLYNGV